MDVAVPQAAVAEVVDAVVVEVCIGTIMKLKLNNCIEKALRSYNQCLFDNCQAFLAKEDRY